MGREETEQEMRIKERENKDFPVYTEWPYGLIDLNTWSEISRLA